MDCPLVDKISGQALPLSMCLLGEHELRRLVHCERPVNALSSLLTRRPSLLDEKERGRLIDEARVGQREIAKERIIFRLMV